MHLLVCVYVFLHILSYVLTHALITTIKTQNCFISTQKLPYATPRPAIPPPGVIITSYLLSLFS